MTGLTSVVSTSQSAHRVAYIHELTSMFAACLSQTELFNLALSHRVFYEPAMDRLWRTLPSLMPLLRCLPEELLEMVLCPQNGDFVLHIKDIPDLEQWERVRHYAPRVRIVNSFRRDVSRESLRLIKLHYPERVLFPRLRTCCLRGPTGSRELDSLMRPSLLALHYDITPSLPLTWHLDRIARQAPNLEVLRLADLDKTQRDSDPDIHSFQDPETCNALSNAILGFGNLTAVDFATLFHHKALSHLSRLPHLTRLHLYLGDTNCMPLDPGLEGAVPFYSLQTLDIGGDNVIRLASWLQGLQLPCLTTLRISPSQPASVPSIEALFCVVIGFNGLLSLKLFLSNEGSLVNDDIFNPLLRGLPYLEEFILSGLPFNPTRDSLAAMASAWPRLRHFELEQTCYLKPSSHRLSLRDLLIFAHYCPTIKCIAIPLSPHMVTNPTRREGRAITVIEVDPPIPPSQNPLLAPIFFGSTTVARARIPVSTLHVLQIADYFEPGDYPRIAEFLANVFPVAALTFRCTRRRQSRLERCVRDITDLKAQFLRAP